MNLKTDLEIERLKNIQGNLEETKIKIVEKKQLCYTTNVCRTVLSMHKPEKMTNGTE